METGENQYNRQNLSKNIKEELEQVHQKFPDIFLEIENGNEEKPMGVRQKLSSFFGSKPKQIDFFTIKLHPNIKSIIGLTKASATQKLNKVPLEFILEFPDHYPDEKPLCFSVMEIFHPYFEEKKRGYNYLYDETIYIWRDYQEYDRHESILEYLLRMVKSLTYQPNYIIDDQEDFIVNQNAFKWYQNQIGINSNVIPTSNHATLTDKLVPESQTTSQPSRIKIKNEISSSSNAPRKKFSIKNTQNTSIIIEKPENHIHAAVSGKSDFNDNDISLSPNYNFYITEEAQAAISQHIGWGRFTHQNRVEQGGILLGKVYKDGTSFYGVIEIAIPGNNAYGNAVELEMSHETWKQMMDKADEIIAENESSDNYIVGWYHTHPNSLDVFMSGTDRNTQRLLFNQDLALCHGTQSSSRNLESISRTKCNRVQSLHTK